MRKKGEAPVVILGIQDYIKSFAPEPEILRIIREESSAQALPFPQPRVDLLVISLQII